MELIKTDIEDLFIIEPEVFSDERGYFTESWSRKKFEDMGLYYDFVQDNQSLSESKGTLRGLHFQTGQFAQAKLVRCINGSVLDVAVDLRRNSRTYMKYISVILSGKNKRMFLIPRGFAHGFVTLENNTLFLYKADNLYNKQSEESIIWNDSTLGVEWGTESPLMSYKDSRAKVFDKDKDYFKGVSDE